MAVFSSTANTAAWSVGFNRQPDHVRRLGLEVGGVGLHVSLEAMRLQAGDQYYFSEYKH